MSATASSGATNDQLNVPGYVWKPMKSDSAVPDSAVSQNARLGGDAAYIGRVRDGKYMYIGTAIPKRGVCIYLDKNCSVKTSSSYEILTVEYLHDVMFLDMVTDNLKLEELLEKNNILPAGVDDKGEVLYVARHIHDNDFYYGWLDKTSKCAHFPKDSKSSQPVLDKDIGVLTFIDVPTGGICPQPPAN